MNHRTICLPLGAICAVGFIFSAGPPPRIVDTSKPADVNLTWSVKIPMRDGVKLHASIYKPAKRDGPVPAIVTLTPYVADTYHAQAMFFARAGYVFVAVDSRGRGNSGGTFEPFANEGKDGHDVVEWVAKEKWCNGDVGMWGSSYSGFAQWATLKEHPPHLRTIVPTACPHPGVDLPAAGGIFDSFVVRWHALTGGLQINRKLFEDDAFWISKFQKRFREHHPFSELDRLVGFESKHFRKWLKHREPGPYWDAMVPTEKDYAKLDLPILTITGFYDGDQRGALEYFRRHMRHGSKIGKKKHHLIIGPWDHAGVAKPQAVIGGVPFGKRSLLSMNDLHKGWYDWKLRDGFRPPSLRARFVHYVGGEERWKNLREFEDAFGEPCKFYLHSNGTADDVFRSGSLKRFSPGDAKPDVYRYDPRDVRPADVERVKQPAFLTDQTVALNLFGAGLVYHSPRLDRDAVITGHVQLSAWIKLDVPDTDFAVYVFAIYPDGKSIFLTQDRLRARYRKSRRKAELIKPGEILRYDFSSFPFVSRKLPKGTRLRLVIRAPNSIWRERNCNSGGAVENSTDKQARVATVTLYHDAKRPSYLTVPMD